MEIVWHGHAFIELRTQGHVIAIDPFITDNPFTQVKVATFQPDYILLTHAHWDCVGDTEKLARRTHAPIVAMTDLAGYFAKKGFDTVGPNIGGQVTLPFGQVKIVPAWHTTAMDLQGVPVPLGVATGLALTIEQRLLYDAGDTGLFGDMALVGRRQPVDVAFLPIGDFYTMGPDDAACAAEKLVQAKLTIPIHYNTFPPIKQDPQQFCEQLPAGSTLIPQVDVPFSL